MVRQRQQHTPPRRWLPTVMVSQSLAKVTVGKRKHRTMCYVPCIWCIYVECVYRILTQPKPVFDYDPKQVARTRVRFACCTKAIRLHTSNRAQDNACGHSLSSNSHMVTLVLTNTCSAHYSVLLSYARVVYFESIYVPIIYVYVLGGLVVYSL